MYGAYISGFHPVDYHTETAGTAIQDNIQGQDGKRLALISFDYLCGSTAHTMGLMAAKGTGTRTSITAAAAAAQKDIVCAVAPKDPAGNAAASGDIIAYQLPDGTWEFNTVASLSTLTITLGTNIAVALESGAQVRIFGVIADGAVHNIALTASVVTQFSGHIIAVSPYKGDPMVMYDANATAAGFLNNAVWAYINK
jgi:hypothetical protein